MQTKRILLILLALQPWLLTLMAQPNTSSQASGSVTTTVTRSVTDTAAVCRAVRDSLRQRQKAIVQHYKQLRETNGRITDLELLALRSDIYLYTDENQPAVIAEQAQADAQAYADSLRQIMDEGDFDALLSICSSALRETYTERLRKECGTAYERAGTFDAHSATLDKYQRKVLKQKEILTPVLRQDLQAEMAERLPNLQAEYRAARINDLRRSPIVYPAFQKLLNELSDSIYVGCNLPDHKLISGTLQQTINPWFNLHFPKYTSEVTGDLAYPDLTRTITTVTTTQSQTIYYAHQVAHKAYYGMANFDLLDAEIQTNLRKPTAVRQGKVRGTVIVRVVVETTGKISNPNIIREFGNQACNQEALRVITALPRSFSPARDAYGRKVRQYFDITINFQP